MRAKIDEQRARRDMGAWLLAHLAYEADREKLALTLDDSDYRVARADKAAMAYALALALLPRPEG